MIMDKKSIAGFKQNTKDPVLLEWLQLQEQIQQLREQQQKIGETINPKFLKELTQ